MPFVGGKRCKSLKNTSQGEPSWTKNEKRSQNRHKVHRMPGGPLVQQCGVSSVSRLKCSGLAASQDDMNDITGAKTTHALCGCVEFLPVMTHDENDIKIAVIQNITSSNFKKNQMLSEPPTSGNCRPMPSHTCHAAQGPCHSPILQFLFCFDPFNQICEIILQQVVKHVDRPLSMPEDS